MLKRLFTSNARIKLLRLFLIKPDEEHFIRELTRNLNEQINSVRRELDNLKKMGLLRTHAKLRKKYYKINKDFIFYNELRSIFLKSEQSIPEISKKIESFGDIKILILSGIFIDKDSPVDLVIVGSIDREKLTNYINNELSFKRPIKFTVMTKEDFEYRIKCNDQFVKGLVEDQDSLIPIKKLDLK